MATSRTPPRAPGTRAGPERSAHPSGWRPRRRRRPAGSHLDRTPGPGPGPCPPPAPRESALRSPRRHTQDARELRPGPAGAPRKARQSDAAAKALPEPDSGCSRPAPREQHGARRGRGRGAGPGRGQATGIGAGPDNPGLGAALRPASPTPGLPVPQLNQGFSSCDRLLLLSSCCVPAGQGTTSSLPLKDYVMWE